MYSCPDRRYWPRQRQSLQWFHLKSQWEKHKPIQVHITSCATNTMNTFLSSCPVTISKIRVSHWLQTVLPEKYFSIINIFMSLIQLVICCRCHLQTVHNVPFIGSWCVITGVCWPACSEPQMPQIIHIFENLVHTGFRMIFQNIVRASYKYRL